MELNFKEVKVIDVDGKESIKDFSKVLGNTIYNLTRDIGELDLAREIYQKGIVEVDIKQADVIKAYIKDNFVAFAQEALLPLFK